MMIMRWCNVQTNEYDPQAITYPPISTHHKLHNNHANKIPVFPECICNTLMCHWLLYSLLNPCKCTELIRSILIVAFPYKRCTIYRWYPAKGPYPPCLRMPDREGPFGRIPSIWQLRAVHIHANICFTRITGLLLYEISIQPPTC